MEERLQKFMAKCGIASRRKCEALILQGRVQVNGIIVNEMGYKISPLKDKVSVDKEIISLEENKRYIALNKPEGYVSTVNDEKHRNTIMELIDVTERIYPIGRLDYNTSGLILLTNDGEVYNKIIHPSKEINKIYEATLEGILGNSDIDRFEKGIDIGDYITAPSTIEILYIIENITKVRITIHEGKNRQIRKMCEAINHNVISLKRISVGELHLGNLKLGEWRYLTDKEMLYIAEL